MDRSDRDEQILHLFRSDESLPVREIARRFGVSRQTVYNILKRHGVRFSGRRSTLEASRRDLIPRILELADGGLMGVRDIADEVQTTPYFVRKVLASHGRSIPGRERVTLRTQRRYASIYRYAISNPSVPYRSIADEFGVSYQTVIRAMRRFGAYRRGSRDRDVSK
jgi:DNA invertase Pin-like site-specific DNA recombinase